MVSDSGIPGHLPHQLASWWEHGEGAARIGWGTPGSFMRCVRLAEEEAHMTPERAKGFCAERYHAATGKWPGEHHKVGRAAMADMPQYDADGLDESWDGDCSDLPDLAGLQVHHFEQAAADMGMASPAGEQVSRAMPKLGTGKRFAKLKGALAAKGAHDPGALAAYIGRRKFGKAKFSKLAAKAHGGGVARSTLIRPYPLEECRILRSSDGQEYGSGRVVEAYAAVFDQPVEIKDRQGHYEEIIDRSAFDRTLARISRARGGLAGAVRVLYNHGRTMGGAEAPEFQRPIGKPLEVRPEGRGLLTRTEYNNSPLAEEILENIKAGSITGQSFEGPDFESSPALRGPGDKYRARNGILPKVRRMILGLQNYGPALYAAYPGAEFLGVVRMNFLGAGEEPEPGFGLDEEYAPADEGDVTGGAPEDATTSRYHQHALYRMESEKLREAKGLVI